MSSPKDEKIVEDSPRMRSVAMMSPPSEVIRESASMLKHSAVTKQPQLGLASSSATKSAVPSSWQVPASLEKVPIYYQLERTHVSVNEEPSVVAQRIAECLRDESMSAIFDDKEARVQVETCDNVTFTVRLWASEEKQVLVEVQRTSGCCFLFHQACKALLRAAKGESESTKKPRLTFTLPKCIPQETETERQECLKDSLGICTSLLQSERIDAHLMALESLVKLSSCCRSKAFAARSILGGPFCETLVSLIQSSKLNANEHDDSDRTETEEEHLALMHRHAMNVLANCLAALQDETPQLQDDLLSDSMLMALIEQVSHCDQQPHEACQAVRCLQELLRYHSDKNVKQRALAFGLASHADFARQQGVFRHLQLHDETQKLLHQLNNNE